MLQTLGTIALWTATVWVVWYGLNTLLTWYLLTGV